MSEEGASESLVDAMLPILAQHQINDVKSLCIPRAAINWGLEGNHDQKAGMKALFDACSQRAGGILNKMAKSAGAAGGARREGSRADGTRRTVNATPQTRSRDGAPRQDPARSSLTLDLTESQASDVPAPAKRTAAIQEVPVTLAAVPADSGSRPSDGAVRDPVGIAHAPSPREPPSREASNSAAVSGETAGAPTPTSPIHNVSRAGETSDSESSDESETPSPRKKPRRSGEDDDGNDAGALLRILGIETKSHRPNVDQLAKLKEAGLHDVYSFDLLAPPQAVKKLMGKMLQLSKDLDMRSAPFVNMDIRELLPGWCEDAVQLNEDGTPGQGTNSRGVANLDLFTWGIAWDRHKVAGVVTGMMSHRLACAHEDSVIQFAMGEAANGKSTKAGVIYDEVCRRRWAELSYALQDEFDLEHHMRSLEEKDRMREEARRILSARGARGAQRDRHQPGGSNKGTNWHQKGGYKSKGGGKSKGPLGKVYGKSFGRETQKGANNKGKGKGFKGGKNKGHWY